MPDRRELELHLAAAGYASRIVVDGVELSNIQRATVRADVAGLTTVEIVYIPLKTPFVLRGQMVVVYDGPADTPINVVHTCSLCGTVAPPQADHVSLPPDWYARPRGDVCPTCWANLGSEDHHP